MSQWKTLCTIGEAPKPGAAIECNLHDEGIDICLANVNGTLAAVNNICPHRQGPLGQGWVEGEAIVCPWHAWAFNLKTGVAEPPEKASVDVYPVRIEGEVVQIAIGNFGLPE